MAKKMAPGLMLAIGLPKGGGPSSPDGSDATSGALSLSDDVCVPVGTLAMPDEQEQMQNPEKGDRVTLTIEGTISDVSGDNACVEIESVNGKPVSAGGADEAAGQGEPDQDDMEKAGLRSEAARMSGAEGEPAPGQS